MQKVLHVVRFHRKGAPEGDMEKQRIFDDELRVLELFKGRDAPCTARSLAWATYGENLMVAVQVRPILNKLIARELVVQGCLPEGEYVARTDSLTYAVTFDRLEVGSDNRDR